MDQTTHFPLKPKLCDFIQPNETELTTHFANILTPNVNINQLQQQKNEQKIINK